MVAINIAQLMLPSSSELDHRQITAGDNYSRRQNVIKHLLISKLIRALSTALHRYMERNNGCAKSDRILIGKALGLYNSG